MDGEINTVISREELEKLQRKAAKFDELSKIVDDCYEFDEEGNPVDNGEDLLTIGEKVCIYLGHL